MNLLIHISSCKRINVFCVLLCLFCFTTLPGCEDLMRKEIDVDVADYPPKLAVTATLDTDGGCFTLNMSEARSNAYYKEWKKRRSKIIANGVIYMFQDDSPNPVLTIDGPFDLSETYTNMYTPGYDTTICNIPARAGSVYRLEIKVNGYDEVTSTAVMPTEPTYTASVDTSTHITKNQVWSVYSLSGYGYGHGSGIYSPLDILLTDDPASNDYYAIQLLQHEKVTYSGTEREGGSGMYPQSVGTANVSMIQDNPDVEAEGILMSMDGESYDLYSFDMMLISDVSFTAHPTQIQLFASLGERYGFPSSDKPRPDYNPETDGVEERGDYKYDVLIKHVTSETFQHYRTMAFQNVGGGIFTEPISIKTNMEGGVGCFSLYNTRRITVLEYTKYYYYPNDYYSYSR